MLAQVECLALDNTIHTVELLSLAGSETLTEASTRKKETLDIMTIGIASLTQPSILGEEWISRKSRSPKTLD
jgi:hypothetical protein